MRWIVALSLRFKYLAVLVPIVLMTAGALQLRNAPVDVFPEFAPPRVEVQTAALGLSATEVEELVTVPLEEALSGLDKLETIRSKSVPDLSSIMMIFEPKADLLRARQLVQERLAAVIPSLPRWASPPLILQPLSATSRAMKIGLTSDDHSLIDMSMTSYWRIRQRLMRVPGVANVAIWGERLEMLQVQVDPERMGTLQVSLNQIMQAAADAVDSGILQYSDGAYIGTGGFIETPNQRLGLRHNLPILTPEDLARVPVASRGGEVLTLADLAVVKVDNQPLIGDAVINDGPGLMLIVEKFPWGNTLEVTRWRRGRVGGDEAGAARRRDRQRDLPASDVYRAVAQQPAAIAADRIDPRRAGVVAVLDGVAGGDHQLDRRSDGVGQRRDDPLRAWRDDQRDGARWVDHRPR